MGIWVGVCGSVGGEEIERAWVERLDGLACASGVLVRAGVMGKTVALTEMLNWKKEYEDDEGV